MDIKWQGEVLNSKLKYTIARAPRQSGKTFTAIQWAREQRGKRVLYYAHSRQQCELIARAMVGMYEGEIINHSIRAVGEMKVLFEDGTSVFFTSGGSGLNRMNRVIERLVVDDVPHFDRRKYAECGALRIKQALFIGSEVNRCGEQMLNDVRGKVEYIVSDYIDLLKVGFFKMDDIDKLKKELSILEFIHEFGPWEKPTQLTNEDYLCLLEQ